LNRAFAWLNDSTLLAVLLPPGQAADEQVLPWRKGVGEATRAWQKWMEGSEPTASVLESRGAPSALPTVRLTRIDVGGGTPVTLAELPKWDLWDLNTRMQVAVSPNFRLAAVLAIRGTIEHRPERRLMGELRTHVVGTVSLDRPAPVTWAAVDQWGEGVGGQLLGWSPDSRSFAFLQQLEPWTRPRKQVGLVVSAADGTAWATPANVSVDTVAWTADGGLLAHARPLPNPSLPQQARRWDWWRFDKSGGAVNLTASMTSAPERLHATSLPNRFVGVADRAVWVVHGHRDSTLRVTQAVLPPTASIVWAASGSAGALPHADVVLEATVNGRTSLTRLTARTLTSPNDASVAPIALPSARATLVDVDEHGRTLTFTDDTPEGLFLWVTDARGGRPVKGLSLNEHVARIAQGRRMLFSYRGADGDSLRGLAVLPPSYDSRKRYPLVVWAYGGLVIRDTMNVRLGKNYAGTFNMEVLAGRGYVVLFPSMPLPYGVKADVWSDTPKGVMGAVDKLIELGIVDADQLAVMGHSFGGYSTYAIVTQTNRFKAAVAMSGHPDLISLYGQFLPSERYSDRAHDGLVTASLSEYGPFNMGGSLWSDFGHYMRNSPVFYLDRVETPLMIVHGDMDGAPIQQGEEAFTALYRLGKRARFIRYWGEGHVVASPVNVRHLWTHIFDWLDTNLEPRTSNSP
jgi:dipeptidyl aminopeptidase/acylaminoacyl peptidase